METRCTRGRAHGPFIDAHDEEFDPKYLDLSEVKMPSDWHPGMIGYCSVCHTAMRWDVDAQLLVDWPEANTVPHCDYCGIAIADGLHYLVDINIGIDTFMGHDFKPMRRVVSPAAIAEATMCNPLCLIYTLLGDERLHDVFNR